VTAAVATCPPDRLHLHLLDAAGGLADLVDLPHVGTWCRVDDPVATAELVAHLAAEVATRRTTGPSERGRPDVLLVVDGWEQLVEADDPRSPDPLSDRVLRLLRDGSGVGVQAAAAGGRSLLHPRWAALGGTAVLLGRVDALDAVAAGLRERDLPRDPPPGRGVLAGEGREVQVVGTTRTEPAAAAARWPAPPPGARPWRYRPLPDLVRRDDLEGAGGGLLVGAAGPRAAGWSWEPASTGGRLLVTGPPRSGRTTTLRALAESAVEAGRPVVLVTPGGSRPFDHGLTGLTAIGPDDVDTLVALRHDDPRLVVLVDDVDRLDDAPLRPVLAELADLADRDGGAVAVATTTAALGGRYRGLDVETARHGCGIVLSPRPGDGEVLGVRPRPAPVGRPGRGVVVIHGRTLDVQVLLPQSVGGPSPPASSSGS
jgi:S-DNA-T family DNA segregation ATPase FtsK/SpoIIIE